MFDKDFDADVVMYLAEIASEFKRFNDREEAKKTTLPKGWDLDIPVS